MMRYAEACAVSIPGAPLSRRPVPFRAGVPTYESAAVAAFVGQVSRCAHAGPW